METIRIRQSQIVFRAQRELRGVQIGEVKIRLGDLVALMICAEHKSQHDHCFVQFQLIDPNHISLKADVLFRQTIDQFLTEEGPDFGLLEPDSAKIYDPGLLWMAATYYYEKYGTSVLPQLSLPKYAYDGPHFEKNYVCFHPLFDPTYNTPRGMSDELVNTLCEDLVRKFGDRALVITDQPDRIQSSIQKVVSSSLYDLVYVAANAHVYIGGDTGFTHYAALRVPHLICLYGNNFCTPYTVASAELCVGDLWYPFASWGEFWGTNFDTSPKYNPQSTCRDFYVLENHTLTPDLYQLVLESIDLPADNG